MKKICFLLMGLLATAGFAQPHTEERAGVYVVNGKKTFINPDKK